MEQQNLIFFSVERSEIERMIEAGIDKALQKMMLPLQPQDPEELLTRKQVAVIYKTSLVTLRQCIPSATSIFYKNSGRLNFVAKNARSKQT
jgi:hypothetical protein